MGNRSRNDTVDQSPVGEPDGVDRDISCRRCNRTRGFVGKYNIDLCRRCFEQIASSIGFRKSGDSGHTVTESSVEGVPEGVLRGIREIDESQTATKSDLEDALDF